MTRSGIILAIVAIAVSLVSCSDTPTSSTSGSDPAPASTTLVEVTSDITDAAQSTSTASVPTDSITDASTSTVADSTTTSTTLAAAATLVLRPDGLGDALFGTDPESVISYVVAIVGPPTADSGWVSALTSPFGVCPGAEVRGVTWGDLTLLFGDSSPVAVERRHFFHYEYGPPLAAIVEPAGMSTASGLAIGTTLTQVFAAHPETEVLPEDEISGPYFVLGDGLVGLLSGTEPTSVVRLIAGGVGCGE